jgi:hypothetical protein
MRYSIIFTALLAATSSSGVFAATLNFGDKLTITTGSPIEDTNGEWVGFSGSYFGVDTDGDGGISQYDKNLLTQGTTGLGLA